MKSIHRIKVNRWPWCMRVPRWFAMKVWLWLPGEWHSQAVTYARSDAPLITRSLFSDALDNDRTTDTNGSST